MDRPSVFPSVRATRILRRSRVFPGVPPKHDQSLGFLDPNGLPVASQKGLLATAPSARPKLASERDGPGLEL